MEKILNQLVDKVKEQVAIVEEYQLHLDSARVERMESEEKFLMWENFYYKLDHASDVLRSLRQALFAFRQAMGHINIDAFYPERF